MDGEGVLVGISEVDAEVTGSRSPPLFSSTEPLGLLRSSSLSLLNSIGRPEESTASIPPDWICFKISFNFSSESELEEEEEE